MFIKFTSKVLFNTYFSFCIYYYLGNLLENDIVIITRIIQIVGVFLFITEILTLHLIKNYKNIQAISINLLILFFGATLAGVYQNKLFNNLIIFNIIGFYGMALFLARQTKDLLIIKLSLLLTTLVFFYYFSLSIPPSQWATHSQNHISVVIIFISIFYYLNKINQKEYTLSYVPALIACLVSLFSFGRSGIISSLVILLGLIYHKSVVSFSFKNIFYSSVLIFSIILVVNYYSIYFNLAINRFYTEGLESYSRIYIIYYWLNEIKHLPSLFFGVDLLPLMTYEDLSSHNSYLSIHSRFGLSILVIILSIINIIRDGVKNNIFIVFILIAILIRSFTDNILISSGFLFGTLFFTCLVVSESFKKDLFITKL